jgi:hypothetical protein
MTPAVSLSGMSCPSLSLTSGRQFRLPFVLSLSKDNGLPIRSWFDKLTTNDSQPWITV